MLHGQTSIVEMLKLQPEKVPDITFEDIKDCLNNNSFPGASYVTFNHGNNSEIVVSVDDLEKHNFPEYLVSSRGVKVPVKVKIGKVTLA